MRIVAAQHLVLAGASAALVGGVILALLLSGAPPTGPVGAGNGQGTGTAGLAGTVASFAIAGNTHRPISPGVTVPLDLRFTNPHGYSLTATHVRVTVRAIRAPRATHRHPCTVDDFSVDQAARTLQVRLAPYGTATLRGLDFSPTMWPHVGMLDTSDNQDGCKQASLTLDFAASGTPVS